MRGEHKHPDKGERGVMSSEDGLVGQLAGPQDAHINVGQNPVPFLFSPGPRSYVRVCMKFRIPVWTSPQTDVNTGHIHMQKSSWSLFTTALLRNGREGTSLVCRGDPSSYPDPNWRTVGGESVIFHSQMKRSS